jgi:hypothetical protein
MILVCTDNGEMILCQNNGAYKSYILQSPQGYSIDSIYPYERGFLLGVEGSFYVYRDDDGDERALLERDGDRIWVKVPGGLDTHVDHTKILSITANEEEDKIYFTTTNG